MRHINIGLLLPSVMQAIGVGSILRRVQDGNITVAEIPASAYLEVSVLIVDPSVPGIDWEALKSASSQPIKIIALLSQQYPQSLLRWFDDTFTVYDTAESIIETLRQRVVKQGDCLGDGGICQYGDDASQKYSIKTSHTYTGGSDHLCDSFQSCET